ncbi:MAG: sulfurtransferase [Ilumatobacteraceae bacterium]
MDDAVIAPVVTADSLAELGPVVLADVRWYLDGRDGRAGYEAGHLPGAIWVDLERDLSRHDLPASEGRHPLPTPETFAAAMSALGIGDDTVVVAYDDTGGVTAGRLVVMLRMLGRSAALLDGGLGAWVADGRPVETGATSIEVVPATFTAAQWPTQRLASADEAADHAADGGAVLDSRAHERFTGEQVLIDPRPGHMPGARSAPWAVLHGPDGRLLDPAALRQHFERLGADSDGEAVAYCGSGVSACLNVIAMEHAGLTPARLFVGSWSGWAADPSRPVELGDSSAASPAVQAMTGDL